MKKFKITFVLFLAVLLVSSCDDNLDLIPEDSISEGLVFQDENGARLATMGIYSKAQSDDVLNGTLQTTQEFQSDNVMFVGSFPTLIDVYTYSMIADNNSTGAFWDEGYETIGAANYVIAYMPEIDEAGFTDEEKNDLIGQARFMRALVMFNLVNIYAHPYQVNNGAELGVPIIDFPFEGNPEDFKVARSTVNEVHAFIMTDLDFAIANITNTDNSLATVGAAQALKARLHLYREEWSEAATLANTVINLPSVTLATDYSFYNTTSQEHIFTIVNNATDGQTSNEGFSGLFNPTPEGRGDAPFSADLLAAFDQVNDLRFTTLTQVGHDANSVSRTFTAKYPDGISNADNAPVLRATEMYLIRAEANYMDGTSIGDTPLNDINTLRNRAGLTPLASIVSIDDILDERRKELCFEGHRRMDLFRHGYNLRPVGDPYYAESALGENQTIFPIPTDEIDKNRNLQQNAGY